MFKRILLVTAAVGLVSACADQWNVDAARTMPVQGDAFGKALYSEYLALAASEKEQADWTDTAYFLRKAEAAARGEAVVPQALAERDIDDATAAGDLAAARERLMAVLPKAATVVPGIAAKAQAGGFDCWMEQQEEGHQPQDIAACKKTFETAMAAIDEALKPKPVAKAPDAFTIFFKSASSKLDSEALATLRTVAKAYADRKPVTVVIAGHTDTAGGANANILLSQKRAEMVANALVGMGVDPSAMALEAYGEEQLAVPTKDGVSEERNRRVEIKVKG